MSGLHPTFQRIVEAHGLTPGYKPVSFAAYKVTSADPSIVRTYKLGELDAIELRDALTEALTRHSLYHKDTLILRERNEKGTVLRLFAIKKKSQPRYVHQDHVTRAVRDLYADPICVIDGDVLA